MVRTMVGIFLGLSLGCTSSPNTKKPTATPGILDLSGASSLELYSSGGLGVSAIRYIMKASDSTVTKMSPDDAGGLKVDQVVTLQGEQKTTLIAPFAQLSRQSWGQCETCTSGEKSVWVDVSGEDRYYFAQEGNCYCAGSEYVPTLDYEEINPIFQTIVGLFTE